MNTIFKNIVLTILVLLPSIARPTQSAAVPLVASIASGLLSIGGGTLIKRNQDQTAQLRRQLLAAEKSIDDAENKEELTAANEKIKAINKQITSAKNKMWLYGLATTLFAAAAPALGLHANSVRKKSNEAKAGAMQRFANTKKELELQFVKSNLEEMGGVSTVAGHIPPGYNNRNNYRALKEIINVLGEGKLTPEEVKTIATTGSKEERNKKIFDLARNATSETINLVERLMNKNGNKLANRDKNTGMVAQITTILGAIATLVVLAL